MQPDREALRKEREAVVRRHMESENVHDGAEEVMAYFTESRTAFPDQRNELIAMHHADDAVIVEFDLKGTHLGPLRGFEPTGKEFTCRMIAVFEFEPEGDGIVCERVYFDLATILRQLGLTGG